MTQPDREAKMAATPPRAALHDGKGPVARTAGWTAGPGLPVWGYGSPLAVKASSFNTASENLRRSLSDRYGARVTAAGPPAGGGRVQLERRSRSTLFFFWSAAGLLRQDSRQRAELKVSRL